MNNRKNLLSTMLLQAVTILHGLILPRLIIGAFGSEVNGLVSSITQFLSFISLLEGGLGAVVLAELYQPIRLGDDGRIRSILRECQRFFRRLGTVFIGYTAVLAVVYPLLIAGSFDFTFTCTLVWILSLSTLVRYMFSITNKLFLQAQQKLYIANFLSCLTIGANLLSAVLIIRFYPHIHAVKLVSAAVYLVQPILYRCFVEKKYRVLEKTEAPAGDAPLKSRWDGFAQNLAHFVNMNTDIALITLFSSLGSVSVYSVYMLAVNALRTVIANASGSYQSALGKYYAEDDHANLQVKFARFEKLSRCASTVLMCTCLLLINPFVQLYTRGIQDADYYSPHFAMVIILANLIYCIREPYRLLILAAGKFRQTNFGSVMEAVINLVISLALIGPLGLTGVAIGTLCAMVYRLCYFIRFLHKNILHLRLGSYVIPLISLSLVTGLNLAAYWTLELRIESYLSFALHGVAIVGAEFLLYAAVNGLLSLFRPGSREKEGTL